MKKRGMWNEKIKSLTQYVRCPTTTAIIPIPFRESMVESRSGFEIQVLVVIVPDDVLVAVTENSQGKLQNCSYIKEFTKLAKNNDMSCYFTVDNMFFVCMV